MACARPEGIGSLPKYSLLGARFQIQGNTLHLVSLAYPTVGLSPSGRYTSERLTRPYSGELPAGAVLSQRATIARSPRSCNARISGRDGADVLLGCGSIDSGLGVWKCGIWGLQSLRREGLRPRPDAFGQLRFDTQWRSWLSELRTFGTGLRARSRGQGGRFRCGVEQCTALRCLWTRPRGRLDAPGRASSAARSRFFAGAWRARPAKRGPSRSSSALQEPHEDLGSGRLQLVRILATQERSSKAD